MRRFALFVFAAAVVLITASQDARAQDIPKVEVFGGYSYRSDDLYNGRLNLNGFEGSVTRNWKNGLGVEGAVTGHYGDHTHHAVLGGVKYTFNGNNTVRPFVHALAGIDAFRTSEVGLAVAVGGGVDARINDRVSIRVVQVDYNPVFYPTAAHNVKVSTGIVFTF